MTMKKNIVALVAASQVATALCAQETMVIPVGGTKPAPVAHNAVAPGDTPEEIARDAARDLKDTRFYNKPGATRAQYDADWQQCRLIARGSRTPSGMIPYAYNPAVVSPLAAGIGGGLGALIGGLIVEGQQRRENRRQCLLIRGWRLVEVPAADSARVAAMTDAARASYFASMVGARDVSGTVTERKGFAQDRDPALKLDAALAGPGTVFAGKKVDPAQPMALAPDEAVLVLAYRRADPVTVGRSGVVSLLRYDVAHRDVHYRPKDWKKTGDKTTYSVLANSRDKKAPYEVQIVRVTAGEYVIDATAVGVPAPASTNCFGAPIVRVRPGEVAYIGDFHPYLNVRLINGKKTSLLAHSMHFADARATLATRQPRLAASLRPAAMNNLATYACSGVAMNRWDIEGLQPLPTTTLAKTGE